MDRHNNHYNFPCSVSPSLAEVPVKHSLLSFQNCVPIILKLDRNNNYCIGVLGVYCTSRLWVQWKQFGFILLAPFIGYIFKDANK